MSRVRETVDKKDGARSGTGRRGTAGRLAQAAGGILRLRGDLLTAGILATLRRWNAHGYRLGRELVKAGLPLLDSATLYRTLRDLEKAGLVSSFWDTSSSGPARRMYSLTKAGDIVLSNWIETMQRFQSVFQRAAEEIPMPDGAQPNPAAPPANPPARRAGTRRPSRGRGGPTAPPRKRSGGPRRQRSADRADR